MMLRFRPLLALSFVGFWLVLGLAGPAPARDDDSGAAPEAPLIDWVRDYSRGRSELDVEGLQHLRELVKAAEEASGALDTATQPAQKTRLREAFLDLASLELVPRRRSSSDDAPNPLLPSARELGTLALHAELDAELDAESDSENSARFAHWLVEELLPDERADLGRRVVAASLFEGRQLDFTLQPLLKIARNEKQSILRTAALQSLIGWPKPEITHFLLEGLDLSGEAKRSELVIPLAAVTRHLEQLKALPLAEAQQLEILEFVRPALASEDWRHASRALELSSSLTTNAIYPVLIDALEVWLNRRGGELASRRIESDIVDSLTLRSGRHLRDSADRWRHWWTLVEAGEVPPPPPEGEDDGGSRASFFSLRPVTQRVTFIIDRSGSMSTPFGNDPLHTRLDEAYDQTIGFLKLSGPDTEFNVILFGDEFVRWKARLQTATERNLESLRSWLDGYGPSGGTHLREAVEEALELRRDGTADLGRLTSDTIIVLCDGKTVAGPDWIVPTLAAIKESSRLVFNCVQIGSGGDASLRLLARESGGDFIHIKN